MDNLIVDNDGMRYHVVDPSGKILREALSRTAAERFVDTLDEDAQGRVRIVPVSSSGKQVLFG